MALHFPEPESWGFPFPEYPQLCSKCDVRINLHQHPQKAIQILPQHNPNHPFSDQKSTSPIVQQKPSRSDQHGTLFEGPQRGSPAAALRPRDRGSHRKRQDLHQLLSRSSQGTRQLRGNFAGGTSGAARSLWISPGEVLGLYGFT